LTAGRPVESGRKAATPLGQKPVGKKGREIGAKRRMGGCERPWGFAKEGGEDRGGGEKKSGSCFVQERPWWNMLKGLVIPKQGGSVAVLKNEALLLRGVTLQEKVRQNLGKNSRGGKIPSGGAERGRGVRFIRPC